MGQFIDFNRHYYCGVVFAIEWVTPLQRIEEVWLGNPPPLLDQAGREVSFSDSTADQASHRSILHCSTKIGQQCVDSSLMWYGEIEVWFTHTCSVKNRLCISSAWDKAQALKAFQWPDK